MNADQEQQPGGEGKLSHGALSSWGGCLRLSDFSLRSRLVWLSFHSGAGNRGQRRGPRRGIAARRGSPIDALGDGLTARQWDRLDLDAEHREGGGVIDLDAVLGDLLDAANDRLQRARVE